VLGLRVHERDATLLARAGQSHLAPPDETELAALVGGVLALPEAPPVSETRWCFARWKPGTSVTATWSVRFADGSEAWVAGKRYADGKERTLAHRARAADVGPLRGFVLLPDQRLALWPASSDRVLRAFPAALDARVIARLAERAGATRERGLSRRRGTISLLRYKPERRAVLHARLPRRDAGGELELGLRVLPPAVAAHIAAARRAFEAAGGRELAPTLVAAEARGLLLETWLAAQTAASDDFSGARAAGEVLARLHALPLPEPAGVALAEIDDPTPLLLAAGGFQAHLLRILRPARAAPSAWTHGDCHPDQFALGSRDERWLLDFDAIGPGHPLDDLASWIADHVHEHGVDLECASGELLAGYARPVDRRDLARRVAWQLVLRAAGSIRRLERGAIARAERSLERSAELWHEGRR
jgi:hypothetical protein